MGEMKVQLSTKFMRNMLSKIIKKAIFKKLGFKPEIELNEIAIETVGDKLHAHINVDVEIDQTDLLKITRLMNLEEDE